MKHPNNDMHWTKTNIFKKKKKSIYEMHKTLTFPSNMAQNHENKKNGKDVFIPITPY